MDTLPVLEVADGEYMLPPDKVAMVVTYLQMFAAPERAEVEAPAGVTLRPWAEVDAASYIALFRAIGTPWLWYGRLLKTPAEIETILKGNAFYIAERDGRPLGLLELAFQADGDVEVAYFGFVPGETGRGLGSWLMDRAQRLAWSRPDTRRLWLHTCTGDDPAALKFYRKMGFQPYARGLEIVADPRLSGLHGPDAGPACLPFIPLP